MRVRLFPNGWLKFTSYIIDLKWICYSENVVFCREDYQSMLWYFHLGETGVSCHTRVVLMRVKYISATTMFLNNYTSSTTHLPFFSSIGFVVKQNHFCELCTKPPKPSWFLGIQVQTIKNHTIHLANNQLYYKARFIRDVKLMFILSTNLNLIQMYAFLTNYLLSKTMDIVIFLYRLVQVPLWQHAPIYGVFNELFFFYWAIMVAQ